jgi:hypothetical protein
MKLELFQDDALAIDIVIDTDGSFGEIFASSRTVASVMGVSTGLVDRFIRLGLKMELVKAEIPTSTGLKDVGFLNEDQIIAVIYKYSPDLLDELSPVTGIRGFFHELANFEVK